MQNKLIRTLLLILVLAILSGCGNAIDCALHGDNLRGHVTFGNSVSVDTQSDVVVQYSVSSFVAPDAVSTAKSNPQGLLAIPYTFCVASGTYQLRAFEDLNKNGSLDAGEPYGLLDGTSTGDAAYVGKAVANTTSGDSDNVNDADIVIDNP